MSTEREFLEELARDYSRAAQVTLSEAHRSSDMANRHREFGRWFVLTRVSERLESWLRSHPVGIE